MTYIEKLLEAFPELGEGKVEWKALGEVAKIQRGASPRPIAKFITEDNEGIPWIKIGDTLPDSKYINNTKQRITLEGAKKSRNLKKGDFIISNSMSFGRPYILNIDGAIHDGWASISEFGNKINADYLYHYLSSSTVQNYWLNKINSGSVSNLNADIIKSLQIPIPPLSVQQEIVRILDKFTQLTARKKQYAYYRDELLSFKEGEVEWKTLGEIGELQRGKRFVKTDMVSSGIPCIHYGEMYTHYETWADQSKSFLTTELVEKKKLRIADKGDVVFVGAGETIEDIGKATAWLGEEGVAIHDACFSYRSYLNPKYVAYFSRTKHFQDQIRRHISSGKISAINAKGLGKVIIPIPSVEEQSRIVGILDKFDTLCSSISEGLPKEIELRQKQYEYYREKLLNFE